MSGKKNIVIGLWALAGFMLYGFILIYLRDLAPGKEEWVASYSLGTHFESRLAHVHGNLFALINILVGHLLLRLPIDSAKSDLVSWMALAGMLMPIGILSEVVFGLPPFFVIAGGVSITLSVAYLGVLVLDL